MDYSAAMERRVKIIEEALVGDPRPGREPGLVDAQRMQSRDIQELKVTVGVIGEKVNALLKDKNDEAKVREGEKRTLKRLTTLLWALLVLLGGGGAALGTRLITILGKLNP